MWAQKYSSPSDDPPGGRHRLASALFDPATDDNIVVFGAQSAMDLILYSEIKAALPPDVVLVLAPSPKLPASGKVFILELRMTGPDSTSTLDTAGEP